VNEDSGFPERLAALLKKRGMTQLQLAARIGVTRAAMSRYVSGEREPRYVTLVRIAEELGVHVEQLLVSDEDTAEISLALVARRGLTDDQKARFRRALDGGDDQ